MMTSKSAVKDVNEYIAGFPEETQKLLRSIRSIIKNAAPEAEEMISYQMPAYKYKGMLVYFAGHTQHIGFYPTPSGIEEFKQDLSNFKSSKGAVQFPLNNPLPKELIKRIVKFRIKENNAKAEIKKTKTQ
ncbi:MAG TPA: DUF1801 domain-containing protein [Segetibacter sp.]|nr:DUF1801 domain-containing protein [Segetibacter sp.]